MKKAKLTQRQENAIAAIIEKGTIEGAAVQLRVSRQTIYNWLKDPEFKRRLEQERKTVFDEAVGLVKVASKQSAAVLVNLLDCKDSRTRRTAAKDILNYAIKAVEIHDLEERLERIEEKLANGSGSRYR
jgi:transposase